MPVEQHPIPQNVTQYQFRLVGDMTLKQFLELAGGIVVALIFYASPLPFFIKWPLIAVCVATGASMAFLPIEGRPLDQWIIAFFRSIYAPTIYTWQKTNDPTPATSSTTTLQPTPQPAQVTTQATSHDSNLITPTPAPVAHPIAIPTPAPITTQQPAPAIVSQTEPVAPQVVQTPTPVIEAPTTRSPRTVFTAPSQPLAVEHQPKPTIMEPKPTEPVLITPNITTNPTTPLPGNTQATFSSNLPIPHPPETPNTIVGMTITPDGKILDSAIIEILKNGLTIRATKSNKPGQFLFAKPLEDGDYQLTAEKEGHTFPVFNLKLEGKTIQPIQLKATA